MHVASVHKVETWTPARPGYGFYVLIVPSQLSGGIVQVLE